MAALELLGYDDPRAFIEGIAEDGGRMTPERKELYELKKWREQQETEKQQQQERIQREAQEAQNKQRLDSIRTSIVNTIKGQFADGLVSMPGGADAVLNQMDQMAAENPETMPRIEDAISAVEKTYTTQIAALLENPKARQLAEEHLASSKSSQKATAPSHRPVSRTIGSDATARSTPQRDNYVPTRSGDREVEDAIARFLRPRGI